MDSHAASHEVIEYPVRDGKPMGETDEHRDAMFDAIDILKVHFQGVGREPSLRGPDSRNHTDQPQVYVSGNNFVYYRRGDPRAVVSPDTYVVKGVIMRQRDTFKMWEEDDHRPCFVLEVTSKSTRREDLGEKLRRYQDDLRVAEYFLFDLAGDWIPELLRAYRLVDGAYRPIEPTDSGRVVSSELQLELLAEGRRLWFYEPGSTNPLLPSRERADQERERADQERERADRLKEELDRLRGE